MPLPSTRDFLRGGGGPRWWFLPSAPVSPGLALGAFGKHPAWDDHMEDLGLTTADLVLAKRLLYLQGIGVLINQGRWERLPPAERLPGFAHTFLWVRTRGGEQTPFLLGRIWSSRDGKGRSQFPMVVCWHGEAIPLFWALENLSPGLAGLESACRESTRPAEVRAVLARALARGRAVLGQPLPPAPEPAPAPPGEFSLGLPPGCPAARRRFALGGAGAGTGLEDALPWIRFLLAPRGAAAPVPALLLRPDGQIWADLVLGVPGAEELACLQNASPAVS